MKSMNKIPIVLILLISKVNSAQAYNIDITLLQDIINNRFLVLDTFFRVITEAAKPVVILSVLFFLIIGIIQNNRIYLIIAIQTIIALVITTIIVLALKYGISRPRPFISYPSLWLLGDGGSPSFPSGHTSVTFVIAVIISLNFRKWYIIIPLLFWSFLVSYSRLDLGLHYPSDVVGGAIIGVGISVMVYRIFLIIKKKHPLMLEQFLVFLRRKDNK